MAKGNYLKGFRVCLIGHFKHNHTDIKKWIQAGGSVVSRAVNEDTTHIVVSLDAWRKKISPELNQYEEMHIVSYDWLNNSIQAFTKRSESQYLWKTLAAKQQKIDDLKIKQRERKPRSRRRQLRRPLTMLQPTSAIAKLRRAHFHLWRIQKVGEDLATRGAHVRSVAKA